MRKSGVLTDARAEGQTPRSVRVVVLYTHLCAWQLMRGAILSSNRLQR